MTAERRTPKGRLNLSQDVVVSDPRTGKRKRSHLWTGWVSVLRRHNLSQSPQEVLWEVITPQGRSAPLPSDPPLPSPVDTGLGTCVCLCGLRFSRRRLREESESSHSQEF